MYECMQESKTQRSGLQYKQTTKGLQYEQRKNKKECRKDKMEMQNETKQIVNKTERNTVKTVNEKSYKENKCNETN